MDLKFQIWLPAVLCGVPTLLFLSLGGINLVAVVLWIPLCFVIVGVTQHKLLQRLQRLEAVHHAELRDRIASVRELQA